MSWALITIQASVQHKNQLKNQLWITVWNPHIDNGNLQRERVGEDYYVLLDLRVVKRFTIGEIYITGANISDTDCQEISGVPMPGRWIQGGIKLSF